MHKNLKKIMVIGASLFMFTSLGTGINHHVNASRNVGWQLISRNTNLNTNHGKPIRLRKGQRIYVVKWTHNKRSAEVKLGRSFYSINTNRLAKKARAKKRVNRRKRNVKRLARKANYIRRHNTKRMNKTHVKVLKSRFRRSNNSKLLKKSGFIDLRPYHHYMIMSKYAPDSRKAVIPKNVNIKAVLWFKGRLLQKNPSAYRFNAKKNGWIVQKEQ